MDFRALSPANRGAAMTIVRLVGIVALALGVSLAVAAGVGIFGERMLGGEFANTYYHVAFVPFAALLWIGCAWLVESVSFQSVDGAASLKRGSLPSFRHGLMLCAIALVGFVPPLGLLSLWLGYRRAKADLDSTAHRIQSLSVVLLLLGLAQLVYPLTLVVISLIA